MKNIFAILVFSVLLSAQLSAQNNQYFPDKPHAWVNDYANLLNSEEEVYLNRKLDNYGDTTSTQIFVVTIDDHGDMPISQMAAEMGEAWKVGQKGSDNGLIILIYPKNRQVSIQVGYGLEEFIPDAIAKRIIENEIKPNFQNSNYVLGIDRSTDVIMSLLSGEFTGKEYSSQNEGDAPSTIFGIIFLIFIFILFFGQSRRSRQQGIGRNIPFWIALSMLSGSRHSHSGSFRNFSSGSGGFGGFSGGGGGSFGGGGASGSW